MIVDFSNANLVDHSTMEKLSELRSDFEAKGLKLKSQGWNSISTCRNTLQERTSPKFLRADRLGLI